MPLAVELYELSSFVHVVAVVIALGPTFAYPVILSTAERAFPRHLPFALRVVDKIDRGIVTPVFVIVGATGVYQAIDGAYKFGRDQWLDAGLGLYVVMFAIALFVFRPRLGAATAEAERMVEAAGPDGEIAISDEYRRIMRVPNLAGAILGLLTLIVIYLMVIKPFTG